MMDAEHVLRCTCVVERFDNNGVALTKQTIKKAVIEIGRNQLDDIVLRMTHEDSKGKANQIQGPYTVRQFKLHKQFINEGKVTINLISQKLVFMISNCATEQLKVFLRGLTLKMAARGGKQGACQHISGCDVSTQFNEISPLNMKDLELAQEIKMKNKENQPVTPHRSSKGPMKRKLCELQNEPNEVDNGNGGPIPKKPLMALNTLQLLTDEQLKIINIIKEGQSVFITGSAGTGKSYLLKRIIKMLPPDTTYCTASTGAAACIINGTTLHSFAGIGTGNSSLDQCISLASKEHKAYHWKKCKILLIDEVSMIDGNYFDKIEAVARGVRKSKAPFGGIQLILCGDFLQLPPVCKDSKDKCFCFQAKSWRKCINHTVELTKVYRQNDMKFVAVLQNIRIGRCPDSIVNLLQNTESQSIERNGIRATKLYTHSADVDSTNEREMNALVGESKTFKAIDDQPNHTEQINTLCPVPSSLELKIGAQVMLVKNIDVSRGLVNGARGIVTSFESKGLPIVKFTSGQSITIAPEKWIFRIGGGNVLSRKQLPLKLAWAISIHKSQGMTLDCVEMSLGRTFEKGQAYVALSRAKCLKSIRVKEFTSQCVQADTEVLDFYRHLRKIKRNNYL